MQALSACMGCARRYRTRDEISSIRTQRDPVEHVRKLLLDHELADSAELKKIEKARGVPSSLLLRHSCACTLLPQDARMCSGGELLMYAAPAARVGSGFALGLVCVNCTQRTRSAACDFIRGHGRTATAQGDC
jgi:hypothetical protein